MTDETRPNYATKERDPESGLMFITEVGSLRRIFFHPPCDICGIQVTSYGTKPVVCGPDCPCRRKEQNDNVHPVDRMAEQGWLI